jgi:hypothetical protein
LDYIRTGWISKLDIISILHLKGADLMKRTFFYYLSFVFLFSGIVIYLILIFNPAFNDFTFRINPQIASNLGSTIAGLVGSLFSLTGILLIVETLRSQNYMFKIQQFETKYFELIKIHRENVNNLQKLTSTGSTWTGAIVFNEIYDELGWIVSTINFLCESHDVKLSDIDKSGMAYTILYFGIGDTSNPILKAYFKRNYDNIISEERLTWIINELEKLKLANGENKNRFVGHQTRLGHYYRHLYQSVKYVNEQKYLNESDKYAYVKILRGQLTAFEQSLLFFNSLSVMGTNWQPFIEVYQLIKNLPPEFTFKINPKSVYPRIRFEYEE